MKKIIFTIIGLLFPIFSAFAVERITPLQGPEDLPINNTTDIGLVQVLSYVTAFLLKVVLPLVIVGTTLYIAYELLTAEGNEEKMKKAWKAVTYSAIGIVCILLAYAVVSLVSRLSF